MRDLPPSERLCICQGGFRLTRARSPVRGSDAVTNSLRSDLVEAGFAELRRESDRIIVLLYWMLHLFATTRTLGQSESSICAESRIG
jgi:hypothetical protein